MKKRRLKRNSFQKPTSNKLVTVAPYPWDPGAMGRANRHGLVKEQATDITPDGETPNPNGVERFRRVDMLETWHGRWKRQHHIPNTDQLMPFITTRQYNAAVSLRDTFEGTQRAPGWPDNDRVQSSPKPDHAVTIQIDRIARYHAVARHMRAQDWPILRRCVIEGLEPVTPAGYAVLREALDWLADGLEKKIRKL